MQKLWQIELKSSTTGVTVVHRHDCGITNNPVDLPELNTMDELRFYVTDNADEKSNAPAFIKTYSEVKNIMSDDADVSDENEQNALIRQAFSSVSDITDVFPSFSYEDITEYELFGFEPIPANDIADMKRGLWAWHGTRKFRFIIAEGETVQNESAEIGIKLYFDECGNESIEKIVFPVQQENGCYYALIDTNILGKQIPGEQIIDNTHTFLFIGSLELTYTYKSDKNYFKIIRFPIRIAIQNTHYDPHAKKSCVPLQTLKHVSIDFGTSSTCIAVKRSSNIEMLALSATSANTQEGVSFNRFENPTNIMVYRWDSLYEEWVQKISRFPAFLKGSTREDALANKQIVFDSGYTVKGILQLVDRKALDAIVTEIKMIPYLIAQEEQINIIPYIEGNKNVVHIVDTPEAQNEEHFDPIAFYGYLLGRAINNPAAGCIHVKYDISYPVKFNKTVRNKMLKSLECGLKMSLPIPLREAVDKRESPLFSVEMSHSEPEAFIGAICGKYLQCDKKPQLFSVFDFGGGTLDFSFGLFAKNKEADDGFDSSIIYFFGSSGKAKFGGEYLISRISFWVLTSDSNKQQIIDNRIPFVVPKDEKIPSGFPESLAKKNQLAYANIRVLNEKFSRLLFEDKTEKESDTIAIDLFNENTGSTQVELTVDCSILRDRLSEIIDNAVEHFKLSMRYAFTEHTEILREYGITYNSDDVYIFKSGNSSRSSLVEAKMAEKFLANYDNNQITLIDEVEAGEDMRYAITPKTAVAYGQLNLPNFEIRPNSSVFNWYIFRENPTNGELEVVINQFEKKKWILYNRIRNGRCNIAYSEAPNAAKPHIYEYENEDGYLYIRIASENAIDCYVSQEKTPSADDLDRSAFETISLQEVE